MLSSTNPTHREPNENGVSVKLGPTDLAKLTIFVGMIPMAPEAELAFIMDVSEVYALSWTIADLDVGLWYFSATVTDTEDQESDQSNETSRDCQ